MWYLSNAWCKSENKILHPVRASILVSNYYLCVCLKVIMGFDKFCLIGLFSLCHHRIRITVTWVHICIDGPSMLAWQIDHRLQNYFHCIHIIIFIYKYKHTHISSPGDNFTESSIVYVWILHMLTRCQRMLLNWNYSRLRWNFIVFNHKKNYSVLFLRLYVSIWANSTFQLHFPMWQFAKYTNCLVVNNSVDKPHR